MDETHASGAFGGLVLALFVLVLVVIPYWKLWSRTGHAGAWALLMLIPVVNLVSLWVLAFKRWPALDGTEERRQ